MKKVVFASFVAFWSSIATIVTLQAMEPADGTPASAEQDTASHAGGYTLQQVAEHATLEDCWMAIEGVVYDFTAYVPSHPAPGRVLKDWCGSEATEGMRTKGYGRNHSAAAWAMMEPYRLGPLLE